MVMQHINRRQFAGGVGLAAVCLPALAEDTASPQRITISAVRTQVLGTDNPPTEHWQAVNEQGLALIRGRQGEALNLQFVNTLTEAISIHFFGLRGPSEMMTVLCDPAQTVDVSFVPPDAGTFWFGPLLQASKQRELGLSGFVIIDEQEPQPFQDVLMLFDDWLVGDDGKIEEDFANLNRAAGEGRLGTWFTVNGNFKPRLSLDAEKPARLRMLNVANTRTMNVLFKGAEARVLARDGQPVWPEPLGLKAIALAPGQRIDLLLTEAQEQVVVALDLFEDGVEVAFILAPGYRRKTLPNDLHLPVNPVPAIDPALPAREIEIVLEGGIKGGLTKATVGKDVLELRAMLEQGLAWAIGGSAGLGSPPLFAAVTGEVLQLNFDNKTNFEQPLHVHGHVWTQAETLVAGVQGPQMPVQWSDVAVVPPKARATVVMQAGSAGTWAIQSLIAERCDAGLIGAFTVADMP
jgi:FtsP/CotA-like multicopper oxidase with cupredoxin domain